MAGGPSTVELVVATAQAGALGFLAGGYQSAPALAGQMAAVRAAGADAFGVNLFVPGDPTADQAGLAAYLAELEPDAAAVGATLGVASWDDDGYDAKLDAVLAEPPAAVSFTFGIPSVDTIRALQAAGCAVLLTVTTPEEATLALRGGPDALCLQGAEAGAHRGSLVNHDRPDADRPVRALLAAVRRRTRVPLVAAGGVGGPEDVADLLVRGADLVQAGTAFLRCPESGAPEVVKDALGARAIFGETAVTRAFSGRRARALVNAMVREHGRAPAAYPEINNATRPLRAAAARSGDPQHMSLYAGTAFGRAEVRPAAEVVERLVAGVPR
jgi:nitronate monooxygenase